MYDLRTATKYRVLDGHTGKVDAIAFSHSGEKLASFSNDDRLIKVWPLVSANILSGFFQTTSKCIVSDPVPPVPPLSADAPPTGLRHTQILWADRSSELRLIRDHAPPFGYTVPSV